MNQTILEEYVEKCRNNPQISASIEKCKAIAHKRVFQPEFTEAWAKVSVRRDGSTIEIRWETMKDNESGYSVLITAQEIAYSYAEGFGNQRMFPQYRGNGRVVGKLEEGASYYFRMWFLEDAIDGLTLITFTLHVPLSPESTTLLAQAKHLEAHPEDEITRRVDNYLKKQDRIDGALNAGIKRIKSKKLPPEDEAQRIEDFKEDLKWMSEDFRK